MRRMESIWAVTAVGALFCLAACAPVDKPAAAATAPPIVATAPAPVTAAPATPPPPLSSPQTQIELPPYQPVPRESLEMATPTPEPTPPAPPVTRPSRPRTPPATHTEPTGPPVTNIPTEPERAPVEEILPPAEQKELMGQIAQKRKEARQLLDALKGRSQQSSNVKRARTFLAQSDEAEKRGDMRQADALAELARILARELNGK